MRLHALRRYPDAITCYKELKVNIAEPKNKKDWDKWEQEKDPKILDKTDFVTSKRYFGFATEDKVEDIGYTMQNISLPTFY